MKKIKIMGVEIDVVTLDQAIDRVGNFLEGTGPSVIYTPNTEIVMKASESKELTHILNEGDLVIPDGIGLVYASKIKKKPLPERVTGFDLSIKMIEKAEQMGYRLFLLGGKEGIAKRAVENMRRSHPALKVVGEHHGYFKGAHIGHGNHNEEKEVIEKINAANPDILFVGFGAPRQEKWIHENKDKLKCKVIIGNGGTVDILAGEVNRAPQIYQNLGIEWLYRLLKDPSRARRQLALPIFVFKVLFSKNNVVE